MSGLPQHIRIVEIERLGSSLAGADGCAVHSCIIAVPALQIDLLPCMEVRV